VISAVNRILPETPFSLLEPLIQTDTPINPGNSGGPLLDRCGEVVGITTAIIPEAQNISFAIPSNLVRTILPSLVANGRVIRPWIGFHGQLVGRDLQHLLRLPLVEGLLVEVVEPGSPAAAAGVRGGSLEVVVEGRSLLLGGDIITEINGIRVIAAEELARAMRSLTVGSTVRLSLFRGGAAHTVEYRLPERPLLPTDVMGMRSATGIATPTPLGPDWRSRRPGR
jgi:S1-C subfamily serine protease